MILNCFLLCSIGFLEDFVQGMTGILHSSNHKPKALHSVVLCEDRRLKGPRIKLVVRREIP